MAQNAILLFLPVEFKFFQKKSAEVSLCEDFQKQNCSYIIPLANGP